MAYVYKRGGDTPKSKAFEIKVAARGSGINFYQKGDLVIVNGVDHIIESIKKVFISGGVVSITGKCRVKK